MNLTDKPGRIDRTNLILAVGVFLVSFIVYALTVQRTFSFWDCGEFIACSYILGIPHPPGTPLFVLIGHLFSMIPFVEDISYRVNYISVISSAFTAMFSYLLTVKMVQYIFPPKDDSSLNRIISYIGGIAGGFFVAFGRTNWANSVEAEVYGMALALSVMIVWMTLIFFENRGTKKSARMMIMVFYLAMLGVGIHMTVFLVVPICAIYFMFNKDATIRDWMIVCGFIVAELLLVILFSNVANGVVLFKITSAIVALIVLALLYKKINWAMVIAIGSISTVIMSFSLFMKVFPVGLIAIILLSFVAKQKRWSFNWKPALMVMLIGLIGMSVHIYIPVRSSLNPRIDENNPSRDFQTFVNYLDRKQYGQQSMVDRMFERRGEWENQLGRHPHMGFWSYFEEQYSPAGWLFVIPFFALGLIGMYTLATRKVEVGLPFFTLLLATSVGLVLYMNFADGTQYNFFTTDAYLEVRNRDYFFTPAFVFFGIAMGIGVSSVMNYIKEYLASSPGTQKSAVYAAGLLVLLPTVALTHNYHANDRSENYLPYNYAANILDSCPENSILFTSGDNDTFPVWCIQEVYDYRKDVTVVNLSLLNTDWYVYQMKHMYNVPISLSDDQILWYPTTNEAGYEVNRPKELFNDRPRRRRTFLNPSGFGGRLVKVQDMMVDEIVIENKWRRPIYFSSPPYGESPLKLRERAVSEGVVYRLDRDTTAPAVNVDRGYNLYMNTYRFDGYEDSEVYRDENATGVFITMGVNAVRVYEGLLRRGDTTKAIELADQVIRNYPEYWQMALYRGDLFDANGQQEKTDSLLRMVHDTLKSFSESNPENIFYLQDLGMVKITLGQRTGDTAIQEQGIQQVLEAFYMNPNSSYAFRKAVSALDQMKRYEQISVVGREHAKYKINLQDELVQRITGQKPPSMFPGR